jgi:hypothetical protein
LTATLCLYKLLVVNENDQHQREASRKRLFERVARMLRSGRITGDEAERLRCAAGSSQFNAIVGEIRGRYAGARLDQAVEDGRLTREEANVLLGRLQDGEHPRFLNGLRHGSAPRSQPAGVDGPTRRDDSPDTEPVSGDARD